MYIEQGLIVFLSVTRIQDDRTSRDRLIVLLQSTDGLSLYVLHLYNPKSVLIERRISNFVY